MSEDQSAAPLAIPTEGTFPQTAVERSLTDEIAVLREENETLRAMLSRLRRKEPLIHSHITDVLPEDHPLAHMYVYCSREECETQLQACHNECMTTWVETGLGNFCLECFFELYGKTGVLDDRLSLGGEQENRKIFTAEEHDLSDDDD